MIAYRIHRAIHPPLDGEGARRAGGRWNSSGRPVVYMSQTTSLAAMEYLVHVELKTSPIDLRVVSVDIPDDLLQSALEADRLPMGWDRIDSGHCRTLGDAWLTHATASILRVPSVVIPAESNYLLNPLHQDANRVVVLSSAPFALDARLFR